MGGPWQTQYKLVFESGQLPAVAEALKALYGKRLFKRQADANKIRNMARELPRFLARLDFQIHRLRRSRGVRQP